MTTERAQLEVCGGTASFETSADIILQPHF